MVFEYKTIANISEGYYKEKGSKFLARAYPVQSLDEVEEMLKVLRKQYHDARHHCYAYVLNPEMDVYRANDDGEPSHSAGDPILGQIRSAELTNILIIVVRYFGGTKLGVSGLINAYKTAAKDALSGARIISRKVMKDVRLAFPYPAMNEVMKIIDKNKVKITAQTYENDCLIEARVPLVNIESLTKEIKLQQNLGTNITLSL